MGHLADVIVMAYISATPVRPEEPRVFTFQSAAVAIFVMVGGG